MDTATVLKAIGDETRFKILTLLLQHNYCVRALSRKLGLSESAISQHIKVLREAGLLVGVKKGYYVHYDVNRDVLHQLASQIKELAALERELCRPDKVGCESAERKRCHLQKGSHNCSNGGQPFCHDKDSEEGRVKNHGNCKCHKS
ncbi:ArsR/SmtB family transcription factor [Desulfofalx alkaliphila]|uniref:ArsR/SmtB family transcription factor n=1 Tax=Desulfofalx alkaliphila TaxID=105483 RepID=UPI0004E21B4D|nr:metalloregulator ArsR/SmtB family transcription factor [Desulfofalx alkaliphila]